MDRIPTPGLGNRFGSAALAFVVFTSMSASASCFGPALAAERRVRNFTFAPAILTVPADTTVVWTNGDDIPHAVAGPSGSFRSPALDTGESFAFTFRQPGEYPYFCTLHPHMTGQILVTAP